MGKTCSETTQINNSAQTHTDSSESTTSSDSSESANNKIVYNVLNEFLNEEEITLYNLPKYYDIALFRDVSEEIKFYISCFRKYCSFDVKTVLEPACGSGIFLVNFPKYGYNITGYDISPKMVEYAKEIIEKAGYSDKAKALLGDMVTMKFNPKFDAAIIPLASLGYLRSDKEIISHLRAMSESLQKGGLYIVEIACACDDIKNEKTPDETWLAEKNGVKIEATWRPYYYDKENKIRHIEFRMKGQDDGRVFEFQEEHKLRLWLYEDFKKLTREAGFRIEAIYNQEYQLVPKESRITGETGFLYYVLVNE
jgi:SAM-dependent methyltransferase